MRATDIPALLRSPWHKTYKNIATLCQCELLSQATKLLVIIFKYAVPSAL